jgi:hypothetical protein
MLRARIVKDKQEDFFKEFIIECERQLIITDTFTEKMFFDIYHKDPAFHSLVTWYSNVEQNLTHNERIIFFSCFKVLCLKCMYEYFPDIHPNNILKNIKIDCNIKI